MNGVSQNFESFCERISFTLNNALLTAFGCYTKEVCSSSHKDGLHTTSSQLSETVHILHLYSNIQQLTKSPFYFPTKSFFIYINNIINVYSIKKETFLTISSHTKRNRGNYP